MTILGFRLGLNVSELSAGGRLAVNSILGIRQAFGQLGRAAAPLRSIVVGVKVAGDALWKLPDQMKALKAGFEGLALPVKLAASAETTAVAFRTLVGNSKDANAALGEIRQMAAATPFEFPELAGAARSLIAFGENSRDVAGVLRKIGDVASGVGAPIGDLATLYGKARVAGVLMTEDINQLIERGIPILQEFAKQTGKSAGEIKTMASEGQITFPMLERAFTDLTSGAGKFSGMMAEASRTTEGLLSSLSDAKTGVLTALGEGLNEALKPLLKEATDKIEGMKEKARAVGKELGAAVNFTTAAFNMGSLGSLIMTAFKAGGLFVFDGLVKAFRWGVEMLKAQWIIMRADDGSEDQKAGMDYAAALKEEGLNMPGLGIQQLSDSAAEAGRALKLAVSSIKGVADINAANRQREERDRQAGREQSQQRAKDQEAKDASMNEILKKADADRKGGEKALLPAPVLPSEDQGPGLPGKGGKPRATNPAARREVSGDGGGAFLPRDSSSSSREDGRRTIKGAGYRGPREEREESTRPDGRRTIKGAGYRPKSMPSEGPDDGGGAFRMREDQRGGLARTGSKQQAAEAKSEQLSLKAAEAVLKFLPSIYQTLKEIPIH